MNSGKKVCSGGKKILEKIILKSLEKRKRKTVFLKVDGVAGKFWNTLKEIEIAGPKFYAYVQA